MDEQPKVAAAQDFHDSGAAIDKVCGLPMPEFGKIEAMRRMSEEIQRDAARVFTHGMLNVPRVERFATTDFGRYVVDSKTGRRYIAIERYESVSKLADLLEKEVLGLQARGGLSRELRERAERAAGRVTAVNFTRAAPDEAIVTHLCEIAELLGGTDVAQLDRDNARLRRELAEARQRLRGITFHGNDAGELVRIDERDSQGNVQHVMWERKERRSDNVTRIEPFPEVQPYAGDWIPPSHKPRMLP